MTFYAWYVFLIPKIFLISFKITFSFTLSKYLFVLKPNVRLLNKNYNSNQYTYYLPEDLVKASDL